MIPRKITYCTIDGKMQTVQLNTEFSPIDITHLDYSTFLMKLIVLYRAIIVFETGDRNKRSFAGNHGMSILLMPGKSIQKT